MSPKKVDPNVDVMLTSLLQDSQTRIEKQVASLTEQRTKLQSQREALEVSREAMRVQAADLDKQIATCQQQLDAVKLIIAQKSDILYA